MAVTILFKNLDRPLSVRKQLNGSAHDPAAESAEKRARLADQQVSLILQRLEAGQ